MQANRRNCAISYSKGNDVRFIEPAAMDRYEKYFHLQKYGLVFRTRWDIETRWISMAVVQTNALCIESAVSRVDLTL